MDNRKNQKVIATLKLEDKGQDFTEIDVLENGVILGNSVIFKDGRLSLLGIATSEGKNYEHHTDFIARKKKDDTLIKFAIGSIIYWYETGKQEPVPWEAQTFKYEVIEEVKVEKPNKFIQ